MDKEYPALWRTLVKKALQSSSLMFYNDANVTETFERIGFSTKDAIKYEHFGCNWCSLGEDSIWMNIGPNAVKYGTVADGEREYLVNYSPDKIRMNSPYGWPHDFICSMRELANKNDGAATIDALYDAFFVRMSDFIDNKLEHFSKETEARKRRPSAVLTYGDCFLKNSLETGECISAGAKYHFGLQSFYMFATVADCFITVDKLVFEEKKLTLSQMLEAIDCNFVGKEDVLALCRSVSKYGSDTPHSNAHVKKLSTVYCDMVIEKSRPYLEKEGLFLMPSMQSDTWHLRCGETYGATPDGRLAGIPFSQNTRPSNGACTAGVTGMLNSMLNLPHDGMVSGALNLDIDKKQFSSEDGEILFGILLSTYFNAGGLHAQVSALDAERLLEAQRLPDAHKDIRVRVTGYSGVFVDISKNLQDDIIERFK